MEVFIKTAVLKAAALVSPAKDVRYYLNGVCVMLCNGDVHVSATDGTLLFLDVVHQHEQLPEQDFQVIVPIDVVKIAVKNKKDYTVMRCQDGKWAIGDFLFSPIDGIYPDVFRVIPKQTSGEFANFCFEQMQTAQSALRLATGKKTGVFRHEHNGTLVSKLVTADSYPLMLVMPHAITG